MPTTAPSNPVIDTTKQPFCWISRASKRIVRSSLQPSLTSKTWTLDTVIAPVFRLVYFLIIVL